LRQRDYPISTVPEKTLLGKVPPPFLISVHVNIPFDFRLGSEENYLPMFGLHLTLNGSFLKFPSQQLEKFFVVSFFERNFEVLLIQEFIHALPVD